MKVVKMVSMLTVLFVISYIVALITVLMVKVFAYGNVIWSRSMFVYAVSNFANIFLIYGISDKNYREEAKRMPKGLFGRMSKWRSGWQ